jgi:hypothetical protein
MLIQIKILIGFPITNQNNHLVILKNKNFDMILTQKGGL